MTDSIIRPLPLPGISAGENDALAGLPEAPLHRFKGKANLLDTFESHLLKSGLLLLDCRPGWLLLQPGRQPQAFVGAKTPRLVGELPDQVLQRVLAEVVPPARAIYRQQRVMLTHTEYQSDNGGRVAVMSLAYQGAQSAWLVRQEGSSESKDSMLCDFPQTDYPSVLAQLGINPHSYDAKPVAPLYPDMAPTAALKVLLRSNLAVVRQNETAIVDDIDIECLHDYRVGLRRTRAALSLFKHHFDNAVMAEFSKDIARLMRPTGLLRDLDVALFDKYRFIRYVDPDKTHCLKVFFKHLIRRRNKAWRQVAKFIASKGYRRRFEKLEALLQGTELFYPGADSTIDCHCLIAGQVQHLYRKADERAAGLSQKISDGRLHALRIECKKLRYALELFAPLLVQAPCRRLLVALKTLQDQMGWYNDGCVQLALIDEFMTGDDCHKAVKKVLRQLVKSIDERQTMLRASVEKAAEAFFCCQTAELIELATS